jgi:high-affinity nickel-transport protein
MAVTRADKQHRIMLNKIVSGFPEAERGLLRSRIVLVYLFLIVFNVAVWGLALAFSYWSPITLVVCAAAYLLGLRHAVDADHIAAIDNVTRKLMQQGQKPVAVGLYFSLGHSTVVIVMTLLVVLVTDYMKAHSAQFQEVGSIIGTSISAFFLLLLAAINFVIFVEVYKTFRAARRGQPITEETLEGFLNSRGLLARLARPLFRMVSRSWQMYPVGFLFGLGFDTATQIAFYAATLAAQQVSVWAIMIFPLLFMAGMCLIDTTDGIVMLGAYGWAFVKPMRKLFYNMTITLISFLIAFLIGSLEVLSIIASRFQLAAKEVPGKDGGTVDTGFWAFISSVSDNSSVLGYGIIALMILSWLVSVVIYRLAKIDQLDQPEPALKAITQG